MADWRTMRILLDTNIVLEVILGFDGDFDRTDRGRKTPEMIIKGS
jgi:hypothetical protein